jgi:LPXTG-motif cell wall-anchored protein
MHRRLGRILGLAVVLAGLTALATYGFAASNVEGKVVEIDSAANRVVVETATGSKVIVMSDPQTMILSGNDSKRLSDVHVGDRVKVSYTTAGSTNTATDIELMVGSPDTANANNYGSDTARTDTYAQNTATDTNKDATYHTSTPSANDTTRPAGSTTSGSTYDNSGHLPQTGSSLPLVGLAGLLLIGLGIAVRFVRMSIS